MTPEIFGDPVLARLGPLPLTRTMLSSAAVSALLLGVAWSLARAARLRPASRRAAAARLVVLFVRSLVLSTAGRESPRLEAFAGGLLAFLAAAAVVGQLPGVPAPTANLPAAAALAALVFVAVPVAGIRNRGLRGYLAHYLRPNPLLFPLHVLSELSRTLALALRLFGNMLSGHLMVALLVALVGAVVPVPLMALDLLIGLLQAYIFTVLACVYVGAAIQVGEAR